MTTPHPAHGRLIRALSDRGFIHKGPDADNWLKFVGTLSAGEEVHAVRLAVHPEGRELPMIALERVPQKLQPVAPHLGADGLLCYAARGTVVLDVFDIAGQTLACIKRAEEMLGSLLRGEMVADLEEEFFAYWHGDVCFLDLRGTSHDPVEGMLVGRANEEGSLIALTNDKARTLEKIKAIGLQPRRNVQISVCRIRTQAMPRPLLGKWPPRTVSDILNWQSALDSPCRRKLDEHITEAYRSGANGAICLIESPKMPYGFIVRFSRDDGESSNRDVTRAREIAYQATVMPLSCARIDEEYIAQRNVPGSATLARRRIALVGCGTIGGFLAELLVKAGAGSDGGELALVDDDSLLPQNIGRHRLGFNSILKNKATALVEELSRAAPVARIHAFPEDVMAVSLQGYDIVVNATGEEALGHLLTSKLTGTNFVPTLTVWVEGPGTAVRALLRDSPSAACTRCLNSSSRQLLYPVVDGNIALKLEGHGCESLYVPFPASASVQAACLAADMLIAWAGANPGHRLRTRVLDDKFSKGAHDQNPRIQPECPACSS